MSSIQSSPALVPTAEATLEQAWGAPVRLAGGQALTDNRDVYRFGVALGPADAPASVIVKAADAGEYDVHATQWPAPAWLLFNEWAGLQFLEQIAAPARVAPRLYAAERQAGLVVMEDLGTGPSLYSILLGDDVAAAEQGIVDMAALLGRLHAHTLGREAEFDALRDALGPRDRFSYAWIAEGFYQAATELGVAPAPGVDRELQTLTTSMQAPGALHAWTHGDASPVNFLYRDRRLHLFDVETGGYRPALHEGVYFRMHFPGCWSGARLPGVVVARAEARYRQALAQGADAVLDDATFHRALVEACAYWVLDQCYFYLLPTLLREDVPMHLSTMRQALLARFQTMAQTAQQFGYFEALGASVAAMAERLRIQWGPELAALPYYAAFGE